MATGDPAASAGAPSRGPTSEAVTPLEWAGWALLAILTLAIVVLAVFRPTDPDAILNEIRLAAGFDRYQAAMSEGDRLYSLATADFRLSREEDRSDEYALLAEAEEMFQMARREAEGFGEDQRAQMRLLEVYYVWARSLHEEGTGRWYERNEREPLEQARDLVRRALALPSITGEQRERMEDLGTSIDRALTPWPIL